MISFASLLDWKVRNLLYCWVGERGRGRGWEHEGGGVGGQGRAKNAWEETLTLRTDYTNKLIKDTGTFRTAVACPSLLPAPLGAL